MIRLLCVSLLGVAACSPDAAADLPNAQSARPAVPAETKAADLSPAAVLAGEADDPVNSRPLPARNVAKIIDASIGRRCLSPAVPTSGVAFSSYDSNKFRRHLALIRLSFGSAQLADKCWRTIANPKGFLSGTIILSPYVAVARGPEILVYYSETAGDARIAAFLDAVAARQD